MALTMSRVDRIPRTYDLASLLGGVSSVPSGATGVSVTLLRPRSNPTGDDTWTPATYASGAFSLLFAGPDADSTGALVVQSSADLWMKITDAPLVEAVKVERITVLGGNSGPYAQSYIGLDTDGVPFFDPTGVGTPAGFGIDVDGVPFFTIP